MTKGTPDSPQCGFSRAVIQILDLQQVPTEKFKTYNVLDSLELREGVKEFRWAREQQSLNPALLTHVTTANGQQSRNCTSMETLWVAVILF